MPTQSSKNNLSVNARQTRIDKDVKTMANNSKIISFFYDWMWSYRYYPYLAAMFLVADAILGFVIIQKVPYTEIDWRAYMQQVETFKAGERDYLKIRGDTGPLVYPAGFVYLFSLLHSLTNEGKDIRTAQYLFLGFYLVTIAMVLAIFYRARVLPPWATVLVILSKRLHSIYILRLFNDGIAMMLLFIAVYLFVRQNWRAGCVFYSLAVSIKMNVLLFAPALFFLLLQANGLLGTIGHLSICAGIQLVLGYPFLRHNWISYLSKAFELSRVFTYKWTVNWRFMSEEIFVSKELAWGLLCGHLLFMFIFLHKYFNIPGTIRTVLKQPWKFHNNPVPIRAERIVTSLFVINFVGIVFARTLHYQFYSWYYPTLPYLLWKSNLPMVFRVKSIIFSEIAFNTFPSTDSSSIALLVVNIILLLSLVLADNESPYIAYLDVDARQNTIEYVNTQCFDGARQLALYYGSVPEELAEGASVVSIDEREIILNLPKMKLTLAIGFGSSSPVTSENYAKIVIDGMLREAADGIASGETMGTIVSREYMKEKEQKVQNPKINTEQKQHSQEEKEILATGKDYTLRQRKKK